LASALIFSPNYLICHQAATSQEKGQNGSSCFSPVRAIEPRLTQKPHIRSLRQSLPDQRSYTASTVGTPPTKPLPPHACGDLPWSILRKAHSCETPLTELIPSRVFGMLAEVPRAQPEHECSNPPKPPVLLDVLSVAR
jgi:hypothetical protein